MDEEHEKQDDPRDWGQIEQGSKQVQGRGITPRQGRRAEGGGKREDLRHGDVQPRPDADGPDSPRSRGDRRDD